MGILNALRLYRGKWQVKSIDKFDANDAADVKSAVVVPSEFGQSVCMTLKSGGTKYLPLSNTSRAVANGEEIDVTKTNVVTLGREGDEDIHRIEVK
jgi:hypothetical protein